MEKEIWKEVKGYEGIYQVSNLGRVKSLRFGKERILKPGLDSGGYYRVGLRFNNKTKTKKVHQLVAMAFLNHIPDGTQKIITDHLNNIKSDNRVENLQLISQRENSSKDRKGCSSNFIGVCWDRKSNKWKAAIKINKRIIYLGSFNDEQEASKYYQKALISIENGTEIIRKKVVFSSNFKGVSWDRKSNKWKVAIKINKKSIHLGYFTDEQEASKVYNNKLKEII